MASFLCSAPPGRLGLPEDVCACVHSHRWLAPFLQEDTAGQEAASRWQPAGPWPGGRSGRSGALLLRPERGPGAHPGLASLGRSRTPRGKRSLLEVTQQLGGHICSLPPLPALERGAWEHLGGWAPLAPALQPHNPGTAGVVGRQFEDPVSRRPPCPDPLHGAADSRGASVSSQSWVPHGREVSGQASWLHCSLSSSGSPVWVLTHRTRRRCTPPPQGAEHCGEGGQVRLPPWPGLDLGGHPWGSGQAPSLGARPCTCRPVLAPWPCPLRAPQAPACGNLTCLEGPRSPPGWRSHQPLTRGREGGRGEAAASQPGPSSPSQALSSTRVSGCE